MLRLLREFESNGYAILVTVLTAVILVFLVALVYDAIWGIDWAPVMTLWGFITGQGGTAHLNQTFSNRSPNYQPLVTQPLAQPLPPTASSLPTPPPGAHV